MEDKENDNEIIPSNDDLPPDPLASEEIHNKNNNNINNNNINRNKICIFQNFLVKDLIIV